MTENREDAERRILTLAGRALTKARLRPEQSESWVELAVVNDMIQRGAEEYGTEFAIDMTRSMLQLDGALIWAATISRMLYQANRERDEIAEGVHFEHDGNTYTAVEVDWLQQLVRGNAT